MKMTKTIVAACVLAATTAIASTDVYEFTTTIKYPTVGKTAFVGSSTKLKGILTIDRDEEALTNTTAVLEVFVKKTGATYTFTPEDITDIAVFGKKGTDCATTIKFINDDQSEGLTELTFAGWGTLKTKTTGGCTPCGDTTEVCSRITKLQGVVHGKWICPCGGTFQAWDGSCIIDPDDEVDDMTVYGSSAKFTLKSVDGGKWK